MLTKMCFILHSVISTDLTKKFQNKYKFELIGIKCLTGDRRSADNIECLVFTLLTVKNTHLHRDL